MECQTTQAYWVVVWWCWWWWWGMAQGRVFLVDIASSSRGASVGVSCLQQGKCAWRGWNNFTSEEGVALQPAGVHDGLVMTVLHEVTGDVLLTRTFNTWHAYTHALNLRWWVDKLRAGRVVVLVVRGAGTYGLGDALPTLTSLGSLLARHAPPRALLTWVFVAGGRTLLETLVPHRPAYHTVHSQAMLPAASSMPLFPRDLIPTAQQRFCDSQAALGPLCDPITPWVIPGPVVQTEKSKEEAEGVGVVVCAGGRFQYLAYTLMRLLQNRGLTAGQVVVAVDGSPSPEVQALLGLLGLRYSVVDVPREASSVNHHLFQYYRGAWAAGLLSFPHARYLAFLDEDVEVSPDWLSLLLHLAPALTADPSLWCVTGTGSPNPGMYCDPSRVVRGWRQPGWGFLMLAKEVRAAVEAWPDTSDVSVLYDTFLLLTMARGRECLSPMMGRSRHYGVGVNTVPEIHHFYFLRMPLHDGSPTTLPPPEALTHQRYEEDLWARLRAATPLTRNPCSSGFLDAPDDGTTTDLVFFFFMDNLGRSLEWTMLAECVDAWPYSTHGMHQGSMELPQVWGGSVWLVGEPASPYHILRPSGVPIWRPFTPRQLEEQTQYFLSHRPLPNLADKTLEAALTHLFLPTPNSADDPPHGVTSKSPAATSLLPNSLKTRISAIYDSLQGVQTN